MKEHISSDFLLPHTHELFAWLTGHRLFLLVSVGQDLKFVIARQYRKTGWRGVTLVGTFLFGFSLGVRIRPTPMQFAGFWSSICSEESTCWKARTGLFI